MMTAELSAAVLLALAYLLLFACTEMMHRRAGVPVDISRKFMHVAGGSLSLLMPVLFHRPYMVLALALSFGGLLWITRRLGYLPSVHAVKRPSVGSLLFPLPIFLCFLWMYWRQQPVLYYLPVAILTFADPMAFIVGTRWPWRPYRIGQSTKTWSGSLAFALTAFGLSLFFLNRIEPLPAALGHSLLLCCATALAEARSDYGFDNLTVPLVAAMVLEGIL